MSIECPVCHAVSHHPVDAATGWCSRCERFTGKTADEVRAAAAATDDPGVAIAILRRLDKHGASLVDVRARLIPALSRKVEKLETSLMLLPSSDGPRYTQVVSYPAAWGPQEACRRIAEVLAAVKASDPDEWDAEDVDAALEEIDCSLLPWQDGPQWD